jgi:hypothetical protein
LPLRADDAMPRNVSPKPKRSAKGAKPKPGAKPVGGRPPLGRDTVRMHITLDREIAAFLAEAWHERRPDGSFYSGPSALIEDLIRQHRDRRR